MLVPYPQEKTKSKMERWCEKKAGGCAEGGGLVRHVVGRPQER